MVTPFNAKKEIDFDAFGALLEHVIDGGVDYLVALGTTAETPTLTKDEKKEVVAFIKKVNNGRLPIVLGIGGNNTAEVVNCMGDYPMDGIAAILSVTPYYNKPSQQGLYEHYKTIAEESPCPVILYNVPGRTGVNLSAETTLRLAHDFGNIVAVKEACGVLRQMSYILRDKPEGFMVISGDDNMAFPLVALGGDGVISVAANAFPGPVSKMVRLCLAGDFVEAAKLQMSLLECIDSLFEEGNPVGIKCALAVKGFIANELRLPLVACSGKLDARVKELIAKYGL